MAIEIGFVDPTGRMAVFMVNMFHRERIVGVKVFKDGIPYLTKLEGLKFRPSGIVREFPDLYGKSDDEMRKIAMQRLKKKIQEFQTEKELIEYLKVELGKWGYKPSMIYRPGFRPKKVKT